MQYKKKPYAVETACLTKRYGSREVVKQVDLRVPEGAIYGFIGQNGAGKSTTLKLVTGLAKPTEGEIRLFGRSVNSPVIGRRLGVLIESAGLYRNMTARENLVMKAKCIGLPEEKGVDQVLETTGLSDTGKKKIKQFSMGMKQRLGVAMALLGNPDLLILDEPLNGLDPEGIRELRQLLLRLQEEGKTIVVSSHILGELSKISTHYGIIQSGRLVEQVTREELEEKCQDYYQVEVQDVKRALPLIQENFPNVQAEVFDLQTIRVYGLADGSRLNQCLVEQQIPVYASGFHRMDLEDYFLDYIGGEAHV